VGKNLTHFMETSVRNADKVICLFTPNYKLKTEGRSGGVGFEYSMIDQNLYKQQVENTKLIPILRSGDADTSIPFLSRPLYGTTCGLMRILTKTLKRY
jgi:hypothetical protein